MRYVIYLALTLAILWLQSPRVTTGSEDRPWRNLPLIKDGQVAPSWAHIGWGSFGVENGSLRTDCDDKGMGLLLYTKEAFGNCQIKVVYRSKDPKSNAGVFVRIDEGMLNRLNDKPQAIRRDKDGKLSEGSLEQLMNESQEDRGPWYAVHHGYEVQICDDADEYHRTGAIYSLAKAAAPPPKAPNGWTTMIVTLKGNLVLVDIDGKRVTTFDPDSKEIRADRQWYEPKREPKRPASGYIGLQNHDPGDVVYFKEVSVRPLVD
jgi:hypothetical protein